VDRPIPVIPDVLCACDGGRRLGSSSVNPDALGRAFFLVNNVY